MKHLSQPLQAQTLQGQIALITGSGRGLGAKTAIRLAQEGALIVVNDINREQAQLTAQAIEQLGSKTLLSHHDISDHAQACALVNEVHSHFGRIDILVNNAGILRDALLHKLSEKDWDDVIRINLKGTFNVGQACAKQMIQQKSGKIINLSSIAYLGNIGQTNYAASKAGVVALTSTWALELAKYNITVNAIAPGFIDSALTQTIPAELKEKFIKRIPLRKMGDPQDIANLVAFLVSDQASYITGQVIHIDGGLSAGISLF